MIVKGTSEELHDFKDMCICALRYALPRHTYVVLEVCDFIKDNASIILDERVITIMLRDIETHLHTYTMENNDYMKYTYQMDRDTIEDLKEFLINYDKSKFRETSED